MSEPQPPAAPAPTEGASERAALDRKTRRAFQVLILQRGRNPGVKGWEMRRYLGKDYKKVLEVLSDDLKPLGLEVHQVPGPEGTDDSTRFLLRFRDAPTLAEAETAGFRIDDLAVLAASIALINSKQGRISRKELETFLKGKFPRWRIDYSVDRYIKRGYLDVDDKELMRIGWRTRAEVDERSLMTLILAQGTKGDK
ncbi:MAG: hypothetical protein JRM86_00760 [Nitrososphaerota archaeon]|nr:hypothetical protein [Nitrososphaerota archaeon]MDG7022841.1 hypothetical protein [Nitrososphaerota archaeon]